MDDNCTWASSQVLLLYAEETLRQLPVMINCIPYIQSAHLFCRGSSSTGYWATELHDVVFSGFILICSQGVKRNSHLRGEKLWRWNWREAVHQPWLPCCFINYLKHIHSQRSNRDGEFAWGGKWCALTRCNHQFRETAIVGVICTNKMHQLFWTIQLVHDLLWRRGILICTYTENSEAVLH
jgi:hypothetical protein